MRRAAGALVLLVIFVLLRVDLIVLRGEADDRSHAPIDSVLPPPARPVANSPPASRPRGNDGPVNYLENPLKFLSTAPPDSLALLPGIGPVLAERLVSTRIGKGSFTRWDDLLAVKGIGPKTLDRLRAIAAKHTK